MFVCRNTPHSAHALVPFSVQLVLKYSSMLMSSFYFKQRSLMTIYIHSELTECDVRERIGIISLDQYSINSTHVPII